MPFSADNHLRYGQIAFSERFYGVQNKSGTALPEINMNTYCIFLFTAALYALNKMNNISSVFFRCACYSL